MDDNFELLTQPSVRMFSTQKMECSPEDGCDPSGGCNPDNCNPGACEPEDLPDCNPYDGRSSPSPTPKI